MTETTDVTSGTPWLVAIGEVLVDQFFQLEEDKLIYRGVAGGGSAFNIAANAASAGIPTLAVGGAGKDWRAEVAAQDLQALGSACRVAHSAGRLTRTFWQIPRDNIQQASLTPTRYRTTGRCPICGNRLSAKNLAPEENLSELAEGLAETCAAVVTDRLTKSRLDFIYRARRHGSIAVLDFGRSNYLRSRPAAELISLLKAFDLVVVQKVVAEALVRRGGLSNLTELAEQGPRVALIVSSGPSGVWLYRPTDGHPVEQIPAPPVENLVDDIGAGDAFLARIIASVLKAGMHEGSFDWDQVDLLSAVKGATDYTRSVLSRFGARGHLDRAPTINYPAYRYVGQSLDSLKTNAKPKGEEEACLFCGASAAINNLRTSHTYRSATPVAASNIRNLYRRVFGAIEQTRAIDHCKTLMGMSGTAYVVGSGGSYPVAEFIASTLTRHGKLFARPIRPFDYIKSARETDAVILVSYSGGSPDIEASALHARRIGAQTIALVTGAARPRLGHFFSKENGLVISYGRRSGRQGDGGHPGRERGFVSMAGTVSPCAVWTVAAIGSEWCSRMAGAWSEITTHSAEIGERLSSSLPEGEALPVFGTGWAWPALLDLESKFVEANLGFVQLHESKDFSHGRFMSVLDSKHSNLPALSLQVGIRDQYEELLLRVLTKHGPVVEYASLFDDVLGSLECLIASQIIVEKIGRDRDVDISRPKDIPSAGLRLYKYRLEEGQIISEAENRLW